MWISKYFVYFVIFSCMGWIYESIFCTVKSGSWQNRGFLYGPVCPIYGVGAATIMALMDWFTNQNQGQVNYTWWQVFLVAFFGSIVLEYVTSWGLEKLFHAYWWDYSDVPLNINGRVCFPASVGFGAAGLLVIYVIAPATKDATQWITPILMELFSLIFMALLSIDATLTVSALTGFERNVAAMEEALKDSKIIVADPLYRPICPKDSTFYELPHVAFSGRMFYNFIHLDVNLVVLPGK